MKQFTIPSYTFTPGASGVGTVNLSGISGFNVKYLVAIINQTRGVVIYSTGDIATRYTNLTGTTLTLNVDTSTHNSGDILQVIYEVTSADPLTDTQLRASAVPISGSVTANTGLSQPLTDTQLRASAVPVSGTVTANTGLTQPLTDTQLRATAVPVSGTFYQATQPVSIAASVAVTGPLTDTQLRATPVPVSGTVTANTGLTQPLTDTQLRATAVSISASALPLPSGAATETTLGNVLTTTAFNTRIPTNGQAAMSASVPVVIASDQSAVSTDWADAALTTYSVAGVIALNTILMTLDLLAYGGVALQITSVGTTGQITPEWSIDNTTWVTTTVNTPLGAIATGATLTTAGLWNLPRQARYLRLRLSTATTAGTTTIYAERYVAMPQYWFATQPVSGTVSVNALPAGTNAIGDVGVQYRANATGAASGTHLVSAATTNATIVKGTPGRVIGWALANTNAAWRYVKLHNQTTTPTAGSGVVRTIAIPPNGLAQMKLEGGIAFSTGIGLTTVTGSADTDTNAVGLGDIVGELLFA